MNMAWTKILCYVFLFAGAQIGFAAGNTAEPKSDSSQMKSSRPDSIPLQIGCFLADKGSWTSMTLMSDYLHNGTTPDRKASDIERPKIIRRAKSFGNTIHLYGTNDDNYSCRRGGSAWKDIPDRRLFFSDSDLQRWYYWFAECRKANLNIVLWLWPNDAQKTYNNESAWPDAKVIEQMGRLLALASKQWKGKPLAVDFVLKLEADDEWSIPRINRIAKKVRRMLPPGARLWYHNQMTDLQRLKQIDWKQFDGIRYQLSGANRSSREAVQKECSGVIKALPPHVLFVGSEYTIDGQNQTARNIGDWILEMRAEYPQVVGVDNAATLSRWIQK